MIPPLSQNFTGRLPHKVYLELGPTSQLSSRQLFLFLFFFCAEVEHAPPSELDSNETVFTVTEMKVLKFTVDGHLSGKVAAVYFVLTLSKKKSSSLCYQLFCLFFFNGAAPLSKL